MNAPGAGETTAEHPTLATAPERAGNLTSWRSLIAPASVLLPAFVALVIYLWNIGVPALWLDEAATWRDASRPLGDLLDHLSGRDAALGAYFVAMKAWLAFGDSEGWLRLPSALAMAGAVLGCADLARRWWGPRAALAAGALLALSPALSRYAQEARPYALAMFLAVAATWLLVRALDSERRRWWVAYAVAVALLGVLQLLALLFLITHLVLIGYVARGAGSARWRPWLWSVAAGLVPCLALVALAATQRDQVAWIPDPTVAGVAEAYRYVIALDAGIGYLALALGLALAGLATHRRGANGAELAMAAGFVVPPVLLAGLGLLTPLFSARYVLPSGLALALLAGAALRHARTVPLVLVVAVAAVLAWPQQLAVRAVDGHGLDVRPAAGALAERCRDGDAIHYDTATVTTIPYYLKGQACELEAVYGDVGDDVRRLWVAHAPWNPPPALAEQGFRVVSTVTEGSDVAELSLWERQ